MFFVSIIFLTILIPAIQSKPSLKLTITPDEKYYASGRSVDIQCEIINPNDNTEPPQLWHVDFKTGRHTIVSRQLISSPPDDSPDVFKQVKPKRYEYMRKNYIRINNVQLEDSAQYECNCPDCEESLGKLEKKFQVIKLAEPKLNFEPGWPIQEHAKTIIKCIADDFYPYVGHRIIRHHHDITKDGKSVVPTGDTYPQKFSWEGTFTPTYEWHNTTLRCTVHEGNTEQHATKNLEVLFTPRFLKCDEKQHVNSSKDRSTIECLYAGNPQPKLTWFRQTDDKPITLDQGITIDIKDEHHGKYKSIVTFDREKLVAIPLTTTTKAPNAQQETTSQIKVPGENYYQQLLNGGFIAKLTYNNEEKASQKIRIVSDENQARSKNSDNSSIKTIENLSTSIILFSFLIILYMIHHD